MPVCRKQVVRSESCIDCSRDVHTLTYHAEEFGRLAHTLARGCAVHPLAKPSFIIFLSLLLLLQAVHKLGAKVDESGSIFPYVVPGPQTVES